VGDSDDKYATFKRDDLIQIADGFVTFRWDAEIRDAVVIRRQDKFASPALATYAAMIAVVVSETDDPDKRAALLQVADYFEDQAKLAADEGHKLPDV
jgi:hypothetical protein